MADVRCPMCGKANPADLKECQFCHARLRPIWDSGSGIDQGGLSEGQDNELPDWLQSLRSPQAEQPVESEPVSEVHGDSPDWLSDLREQPVQPGDLQPEEISDNHLESADEDASEWLQTFLGQDDLAEAEEKPGSAVISDASIQDEASWFARIGSTPVEEDQPPGPAELLDWLSESENETPAGTSSGKSDSSSSTELQPPQPVEPLPDQHVTSEQDSSDWLIEGPDDLTHANSGDLTPEQLDEWLEAQDLPSWLFEATSDEIGALVIDERDLIDQAEPEGSGGLVEEPLVQPFEPVNEIHPVDTSNEDILDQNASDDGMSVSMAPEIETPDETDRPQSPFEDETNAYLFGKPILEVEKLDGQAESELPPETLADEFEGRVEDSAPFLAVAGTVAAQDLDFGEDLAEEDLSWLDELESAHGGLSSDVSDEPISEQGAEGMLESISTLPQWLTSGSEEAQISEQNLEEESELKPADMPSWLRAKRPLGVSAVAASVLGDPDSQQVEGAGPLAGLRGALPAEPDVSKVQKPPVYSVKLQLTEPHQLQAELLRGLIETEDQSPTIAERSIISSQKVIRLLIGVLLIVPLVFVLLTGMPQLSLPVLPMGVDAVGRLIDGLQPGAPVLLAIDYQPGFSGEMDTITVPVIQDLFDHSAYPAAVSTIATGPVQAEHLFTQARISNGAPAQPNVNYANLGYLPGGATGLLAFAQSPQQVLPTNIHGEQVWDIPALQPAIKLDKFAMVIVATDNPDVARYWIEQVRPYLGATPMVMVLSAQAEPVVKPYYEANPPQIQGLVGGLAGGAAYLNRSSRSGAATRYWSPFGVGALIAVILMIFAGLANLASAEVRDRKTKVVGGKGS